MIRKTLVKKVKIINLRKKNEWTKKKIDNIKGVIEKKKKRLFRSHQFVS